ncbi:MAG: ABC transporter permease [Thiomicrorhabdus sp.]|jgi:peptide/nickel transport system permease protein|nr:ABC transporter permease [Thiomicrorhabdus sp.]
MSFVWLWTDLMVWSLLFVILAGIRSIKNSEQARKQWRSIFESRVAMASMVILTFYFVFALLGSVHVQLTSNGENTSEKRQGVYSVLDLSLIHLIEQTERTYSAPFATHEYSTSLNFDENGQVSQSYLVLKHGGQHLTNGASIWLDVLVKTGLPLLVTLGIMALLLMVHAYFRFKAFALRSINDKANKMPWKTAYISFFSLLFLFIWFYYMSHFYHVLGTDKVGQDVLLQSIKSIRTGVLIGLLTTLVMLPLALILGISAGYFKGWVDDVIQYLYTTLNSIPGVLLIAAAVLVMQVIITNNSDWFGSTEERADLRLLFLIFILGLTSWTGLCRLLRAETLKISQVEYVSAAKAFGLGPFKIIKNHILPNLMHLVLIALVLDFSGLVLAEAVLSYVGVGVDPTTASWGNMINQARLEMAREPMVWWSLFSAFVFMFTLVLAANLFSDRVQTVLDPRRVN